jgi:hypothetical protein
MKPSVIVWDLETVPDLGGFAAANDLVGKSDVEVREAIGDKFPKHIYHSIVCIGALIAHWEPDHWAVDAVGAPHVGETMNWPAAYVAAGEALRAGRSGGIADIPRNAAALRLGAKWLGLLKEIAPNVTRVGVIREPTSTSSIGQFGATQSAARLSKVEVSPLGGQERSSHDLARLRASRAFSAAFASRVNASPLRIARGSGAVIRQRALDTLFCLGRCCYHWKS